MRAVTEFFGSPLAMVRSRALGALENIAALTVTREDTGQRGYEVVQNVAVIEVRGVLVHTRTWWSWDEISYDQVALAMADAIADDKIRGVALVFNSPGGEVSGCFDLADAMYQLRGTKPIIAIADEACYSAAYALASSADRVIIPRTGGVGSVGVVALHVDITGMLDQAGVKVTTIQFGERKSDSYPTTPSSDDARDVMQADIDTLGEMFVAFVARNRGMSKADVRATQAGCFLGEAGVDVGFADDIASADQALVEFVLETMRR